MQILHQDCDPDAAEDRSLPYNSYLVWYEDDGVIKYDLVISNKKVEIFDHYWDRYREDLKGFKQTEGRTNPKLWSPKTNKSKKK